VLFKKDKRKLRKKYGGSLLADTEKSTKQGGRGGSGGGQEAQLMAEIKKTRMRNNASGATALQTRVAGSHARIPGTSIHLEKFSRSRKGVNVIRGDYGRDFATLNDDLRADAQRRALETRALRKAASEREGEKLAAQIASLNLTRLTTSGTGGVASTRTGSRELASRSTTRDHKRGVHTEGRHTMSAAPGDEGDTDEKSSPSLRSPSLRSPSPKTSRKNSTSSPSVSSPSTPRALKMSRSRSISRQSSGGVTSEADDSKSSSPVRQIDVGS
ncbi:unnamed protein product, partial [Amoebophrya sp. A25]